MADAPLASDPRWIVWRLGYPDPSVRQAVIVYDKPADAGAMLIGPAHRELTLKELVQQPCDRDPQDTTALAVPADQVAA